jgi:hypothetical protein
LLVATPDLCGRDAGLDDHGGLVLDRGRSAWE